MWLIGSKPPFTARCFMLSNKASLVWKTLTLPSRMDLGFAGALWDKACNGTWVAVRVESNISWSISWTRWQA